MKYISEELIHKALYPYPDDLVIATKAGPVRTGSNEWHPIGRPEYLRQENDVLVNPAHFAKSSGMYPIEWGQGVPYKRNKRRAKWTKP